MSSSLAVPALTPRARRSPWNRRNPERRAPRDWPRGPPGRHAKPPPPPPMSTQPDPHGASGSVPLRRTDPLRAAVFGGSFDPIHVGHTGIAERATDAFRLERVLWIPARRPPHKPDRVLAEDHMRLAMALLATAHRPRWTVLDLELSRPGASYTYDTLLEIPEHLARYTSPRSEGGFADRRRELELFLIIGSDNLPGLPGWRNAEDVLRIARPIVVLRDGDRDAHLAGVRGRVSSEALERIEAGFLELPPLPQSSTAIREALARGEMPEGALAPEVEDFIRAKGLYGFPAGPAGGFPPRGGALAGDGSEGGGHDGEVGP